jgi:hypothetical protein
MGEYFFVNVDNTYPCLICNANKAVDNKCIIERHFMTTYKDYISKYPTTEKAAETKLRV